MGDNPIIKAVLSLIENDDSKVIGLKFGTREVKPGEKIPKGEAHGLPTLTWNALSGQKFIVISLDIDAPFPSFAPLSPALHWLQTGLEVEASSGVLTSSDPVIAFWAPPRPPPISSPHRYLFLLYQQPEDCDVGQFTKACGYGIKDRMRWDLSNFEKQAKLGPVAAATYFFSN
ncbi:PEBP-like protein [Rhizodiscina lignyota]|uniref:PEBP-like protein n=1 Tax=Rhizodiscina lignyota TaxID=1504668 RepID=A0A9P4MA99_9PEZI|nr:PEBP-like protein [Rhizodiscina lignyota]